MFGIYCADLAISTAISEALELCGLEPDPIAVRRRPKPAMTLGEQTARMEAGQRVLDLVARRVPVGEDDRLLIRRLVDSACARVEDTDQCPPDQTFDGVSITTVVAYAAGGGGALGSFESFLRSIGSSVDWSAPAGRQDVTPAPSRNPTRRPNPPGTAAPAKTNPTRTIRSSRWTGGRKAVQS